MCSTSLGGGSWAGQRPVPTHWRFAALGMVEWLETAYCNSICVLEESSLGEGNGAAVPVPAEPPSWFQMHCSSLPSCRVLDWGFV